jgi:beta-N-acetylhexosaminidase
MIMTAHILCKKIDPDYPATLSKKILQEILRKRLRYNGLIISDDMEMKAITNHFGKEKAPILAIKAGCDLLIYRSEAEARTALNAIQEAIRSETLPADRVVDAALRSLRLKKESLIPYRPIPVQEITGKLLQPTFQELLEKLNEEPVIR